MSFLGPPRGAPGVSYAPAASHSDVSQGTAVAMASSASYNCTSKTATHLLSVALLREKYVHPFDFEHHS
jgi:hypothetical protein